MATVTAANINMVKENPLNFFVPLTAKANKKKNNMIISRDSFGEKPLYYMSDSKKIIFYLSFIPTWNCVWLLGWLATNLIARIRDSTGQGD